MEAAAQRETSTRAALVLIGTALPVYLVDQLTKALVAASLSLGARVEVVGDLVQLWHVQNRGAAFSLLQGATILFVVVTVVALGMVVYFHRSLRGRSSWVHAVLGLVLAGTLGNLTDRLRLGYVVDFVSVGIGDLRWPTFNVADSALVIGIGLLVAYLTFVDGRRDEPAA